MTFVFSDIFYENYVIEVLYCMKLSQFLTILYEYEHSVMWQLFKLKATLNVNCSQTFGFQN